MADDPTVSVILPVRDGERFLRGAVESVLEQEGVRLDLIVVDDGSVDSSLEIARTFEPEARCISTPPQGLPRASNAGIEAARGEFVVFMGCDDLWPPGRLALQLEAIRSGPPPDLVFGHELRFPARDRTPRPAKTTGTVLIRRSDFARVGLFATEWQVGEFLDWLLRAQDLGLTSKMLPDVVVYRRRHDANMTLRLRDSWGDYAKVLGHALARRRAEGTGAK